jgi:hypothetical protein
VQKQISLRVSANGIRRKCFPWVGRAFSAKASAWSLPATQILFRKLFGFGFYPSGNWNALRISKKVAPSNLEKSSSMQKRENLLGDDGSTQMPANSERLFCPKGHGRGKPIRFKNSICRTFSLVPFCRRFSVVHPPSLLPGTRLRTGLLEVTGRGNLSEFFEEAVRIVWNN